MSLLTGSPAQSSGKNFILSMFFLVLVIALFFIPEIIELQSRLSGTGTQRANKISKAIVVEEVSPLNVDIREVNESSKLDKILALIERGYLDKEDKASLQPGSLEIPQSRSAQSRELTQHRDLDGGLSWQMLKGAEVRKSIINARRDVAKLYRELSDNHYQTRFSLLNYSNGLNWILEAEKSPLTALEALNYLERLDLEVTQTMLAESVDRSDILRWSKISLGPLSKSGQVGSFKQQLYIPFDPKLTLAELKIVIKPSRRDRRGRIIPGASILKIRGFLLGKDTKKLELLQNGRKVKKASVKSKVDDQGKRIFNVNIYDAYGIFTLRATAKDGSVYDKSYRFLPEAYKFPRYRDGEVRLPFRELSDSRDFDIRSVDLRLDRYFRVSTTDTSPRSGFSTFSGSDAFVRF